MSDKENKTTIIRARITEEQDAKLVNIIKELQAKAPGAEVNVSTITRYALEKYINEYEKEVLTVEIPLKTASDDELKVLAKGLLQLDQQITPLEIESNSGIKLLKSCKKVTEELVRRKTQEEIKK